MNEWNVVGVLVVVAGLFLSGWGAGDPAEQHSYQALHAGGGAAGSAGPAGTEQRRRPPPPWKHNDEQDATLTDHETRITILERKD